jgi:hypothetical protein
MIIFTNSYNGSSYYVEEGCTYADRNFSENQSDTDEGWKYTINLSFNKGWNYFYYYEDTDKKEWGLVSEKPSEISLSWIFYDRQKSVQQKQKIVENLMKIK